MKKLEIALAGNPNSGKSTVFNMLSGGRQHVGNYPGVTVEKKEGRFHYKDYDILLVDLPGTYSLSAYSTEELVARDYITENKPDVVVDVIDASNVERNLYLTTQLMEMDVPLVLAFNMSDVARQKGLVFDTQQLSQLLDASIVMTVASREKGLDELLDAIIAAVEEKKQKVRRINYGSEIEGEITKLEKVIGDSGFVWGQRYPVRFAAVKLLEQDRELLEKMDSDVVRRTLAASVERIRGIWGDEPDIILADKRYGFISGACQETIKSTVELRHSISDIIDTVVTHKVLGLPIFLALMYLTFMVTFTLAEYPMGWLESLFGWSGSVIIKLWPAGHLLWLRSLLVEGVIGGVGGVIVFLPNILLLFAAIAILEASGYMARAAFVMDRIMHKIGLHGKSFIPMLIGFGCSVPAIMATRILENRRNRLTTIMIIPLMSCGARLTIYGLIIPAFFSEAWRGPILWLMYIIGIVLAVICAKVLRLTVFKGETVPYVMELPPYRMPTVKGIAIHMWERGWMYLKKAGTVILAISVILWGLANYPKPPSVELAGLDEQEVQQTELSYSILGKIGKAIEPALKPLGFDWKIGTALIGATAAKEVFVSQLGIIYAAGTADERSHTLRNELKRNYTKLNGFCVMLFCLIYAPCVATLAVTRIESGGWKWAALQFFGLTVLAYVLTFFVYQLGTAVKFVML